MGGEERPGGAWEAEARELEAIGLTVGGDEGEDGFAVGRLRGGVPKLFHSVSSRLVTVAGGTEEKSREEIVWRREEARGQSAAK